MHHIWRGVLERRILMRSKYTHFRKEVFIVVDILNSKLQSSISLPAPLHPRLYIPF